MPLGGGAPSSRYRGKQGWSLGWGYGVLEERWGRARGGVEPVGGMGEVWGRGEGHCLQRRLPEGGERAEGGEGGRERERERQGEGESARARELEGRQRRRGAGGAA